MKVKDQLTVFVSDHCFNCKESIQIAEDVRSRYDGIVVTVVDVDHTRPSVDIFAVPTYALNGKIVFLGNPTDEQIDRLLKSSVPSRK